MSRISSFGTLYLGKEEYGVGKADTLFTARTKFVLRAGLGEKGGKKGEKGIVMCDLSKSNWFSRW
jgi:hypothetical protein